MTTTCDVLAALFVRRCYAREVRHAVLLSLVPSDYRIAHNIWHVVKNWAKCLSFTRPTPTTSDLAVDVRLEACAAVPGGVGCSTAYRSMVGSLAIS